MPFPHRLLFVLGLVLLVPAVHAQPGDLTGFSFLRIEPSARAAALGGSFAAVYSDDVNGMFYNPALLNEETHRSLSVSYLNHVSDLNAGFLAYGFHLEDVGTLGAGLRFLSWGRFDEADSEGNRLGSFGASDVALTLGLARSYTDQLHYGLNVHGVFTRIDTYTATALAVDLGAVYQLPGEASAISISLNNLGTTFSSLGTTTDELPLDLRVGLTRRLRYIPLMLSLTAYNLHDLEGGPENATALDDALHHLAFGGEFQFSDAFQLRFGYNHRRHEALKLKSRLDFAGFGFGVGLMITRLRFDYAFNSWSSLGGLHQFTLRTVL